MPWRLPRGLVAMRAFNLIMGMAAIGAASAGALFSLLYAIGVDQNICVIAASTGGTLASFVMLDKIKPEK